jgi:ATP-dependent protease ClpP protease subunit
MSKKKNQAPIAYYHALEAIHCYGVDVLTNQIYLDGSEHYGDEMEPGVEFTMANKFIRNLNILQTLSDEPILIHMKTCGGDMTEGLAIFDAIQQCPNYVSILNYTHARSMSSMILQAADYRYMMPHSTFMFHMGSMYMGGTTKQWMTEHEELMKSNEHMMNIYIDQLKKTGNMKKKSRKQIRKWLQDSMDKKEEVYLNAEEAIEIGFADEIWDIHAEEG